jgi:hypothetical protein
MQILAGGRDPVSHLVHGHIRFGRAHSKPGWRKISTSVAT